MGGSRVAQHQTCSVGSLSKHFTTTTRFVKRSYGLLRLGELCVLRLRELHSFWHTALPVRLLFSGATVSLHEERFGCCNTLHSNWIVVIHHVFV